VGVLKREDAALHAALQTDGHPTAEPAILKQTVPALDAVGTEQVGQELKLRLIAMVDVAPHQRTKDRLMTRQMTMRVGELEADRLDALQRHVRHISLQLHLALVSQQSTVDGMARGLQVVRRADQCGCRWCRLGRWHRGERRPTRSRAWHRRSRPPRETRWPARRAFCAVGLHAR
jgi:hypothetical protein